jgi:hypothetical protein
MQYWEKKENDLGLQYLKTFKDFIHFSHNSKTFKDFKDPIFKDPISNSQTFPGIKDRYEPWLTHWITARRIN